MGSSSSSMLSASMHFDVAASADHLWDTFVDYENIPSYVTNIHSIRLDNSGVQANGTEAETTQQQQEQQLGSIVRFVREKGYQHVKSKQMEMEYRVTTMSKSKDQYVLGASVSSTTPGHKPIRDGARTGTLTIYPVSKTTCRLVWTFAAAPDGWRSTVIRFFLRCILVYLVKRTVRPEIEDYIAEAVRRQLNVCRNREDQEQWQV